MDIIIRNGVIQENEENESHKSYIKNEASKFKKNFDDYITNSPGPYYDLKNSHLCIPRDHYNIQNFIGPQYPYLIKVVEITDYNKKAKYCSICHCKIKQNSGSSEKRKIFIDDNYYEQKKDTEKPIDIESMNCKDISLEKPKIYNEVKGIEEIEEIEDTTFATIKKHKIINKFYKIVYKLLNPPILYPISTKETVLIWPWELTPYQKFRLENENYKSCSFYSHQESNKIDTNYVMIE